MPEIEIRPAAESEIPALCALEHVYQTQYVWQMDRLFDEDQISVNFRQVRLPRQIKVDYPRSPRLLLEESPASRQALLGAWMEGVPLGYTRLGEYNTPKSLWTTDLVVREAARRKGVGTALALAAQEWAVEHQYRRNILVMQSKNHPAIQFAKKLGYEFCGYSDQFFPNQDIAIFFCRSLR